MKMKIKRKGIFLLGLINLILGTANGVLLLLGRGGDIAPLAFCVCTFAGIGSIIDSLE